MKTTAVMLNPGWAKYLEVARVNFANHTTYMTNVLARSATVVFRIWVFTQLYRVTYAVAGAEAIGGLTVPMVIWILMFTQGFQSATRPSVTRLIDEEVKSGSLAYSINRPYSYLLFHYAGYLGRVVPVLTANIIIGSLAALILAGPVVITWAGWLAGLWLLFFGYTLDFLMSFILGITAFWVEDTSAFWWIYSKGQMVFGGNVLPLALFPGMVKTIAELSPFAQLFYASAQIMVSFDIYILLKFAIVQAGWIVLFALLAGYLLKKGRKYVSINGG